MKEWREVRENVGRSKREERESAILGVSVGRKIMGKNMGLCLGLGNILG